MCVCMCGYLGNELKNGSSVYVQVFIYADSLEIKNWGVWTEIWQQWHF